MTAEARLAEEQDARAAILDAYAELCPGIIDNPYLAGHFPLPMQWMFLRGHLDYPPKDGGVFQALYGGAAGGGKLSPMDTPVLTPKGWRAIGDLEVGDDVTDPTTGGSCRVIARHRQGVQDIYRVTFDDGASVEVGLEHLWAFKRSGHHGRRTGTKPSPQREWAREHLHGDPRPIHRWTALRVGDTAELMKYLAAGERVRIPLTEPVVFTVNGRTGRGTLDPYFIGAYLGDGTHTGQVSNIDVDFRAHLVSLGCTEHAGGKSLGISGPLRKSWQAWCANHDLRGKRAWEKHLPPYILTAPLEYRLAVLQGLMDTDGTVDKQGRCSFASTSRALAEGVCDLVRGFGGKARIRERQTYFPYKGERKAGRKSYIVSVQVRKTSALFRLTRKRKRCTDSWNGGYELMRAVESIEKVRRAEAVCITVSNPLGLYVTKDYIVTHNSDALLMAVAQYVDQPDYAGLIFRRTFADLALPGAIMDRARDWWINAPGVAWDGTNKTFRFASGAKVSFAYLQHAGDELRYQGAEFQCIGWDELTQFPDRRSYRYLLSRIRRPVTSHVPLRSLSASNPGGPGHSWVASDFDVELDGHGFPFYPARVVDNPYIDREAYIAGLMHLHPTTRAQLLNGDWRAREPGDYFRREWFGPLLDPAVDLWPSRDCRRVRWWDLAASIKEGAAHTAGVRMARHRAGVYAIEHCASFQATPGMRDSRIVDIARSDGPSVTVGLEIEPGSGGPAQVEAIAEKLKTYGIRCVYARPRSEHDDREKVYVVRAPSSENAKAARCDPVAACLERGYARRGEGEEWDAVTQDRVPWWGLDAGKPLCEQADGIRLFAGDWTQAYLDIVEGFPGDGTARVDEADATSGAWAWLKSHPSGATQAPATGKKEVLSTDEIRRLNPAERPKVDLGKDRGGRWRP